MKTDYEQELIAPLACCALKLLATINDTGLLDAPKGKRATLAAKQAKELLRQLRQLRLAYLDDGSGFESTVSDCW